MTVFILGATTRNARVLGGLMEAGGQANCSILVPLLFFSLYFLIAQQHANIAHLEYVHE